MGGRALLGLFGGLVLLAGYQVGWYGLVMLRGLAGPGVDGGIAFLDLLVPGKNKDGSVDAKLTGGGTTAGGVTSSGPSLQSLAGGSHLTIPGPTQSPLPQVPGYKPGSAYYPPVPGAPGGNPLAGQSIK